MPSGAADRPEQVLADYAPLPIRPPRVEAVRREDGSILIRQHHALPDPWPSIPALLIDRARRYPDRALLAKRRREADGSLGDWATLTYGDALERARRIASALLRRDIGPDVSVMVLSGPSADHLVLSFAAQMARVPYVPVSPNFSLLGDFARLRHAAALCRPKVLFADDADAFADAIAAIRTPDMLVLASSAAADESIVTIDRLLTEVVDEAAVAVSIAAITPDTHAKTIFTSGSTGRPKAVIQTQRMLTGIIQQHDALYYHDDEKDDGAAYMSWLTWSHVGANNVLVGDVLNDGATFYVDDGRPIPGQFGETIRNLHEIHPREFGSAPVFFAHLASAMEADSRLRDGFFSRLRYLAYATAGLSQDVFDRLQRLAVQATGRRIPIVSKYGTTETQGTLLTCWPIEHIGALGLPFPGVTIKLAPVGTRYEIRVKGNTVTPGYLRDPEATAAALDEEGFYRTGDAGVLTDPEDPAQGVSFDGRISENFKLGSGTWVSVGSLRIDLIEALAPLVHDLVITGENRDYLGALVWLREDEARALQSRAGQGAIADHLLAAVRTHNASAGGSSRRIARLLVLELPPQGDEVADKGYINQREVLRRRAEAVERLYSRPDDAVLVA